MSCRRRRPGSPAARTPLEDDDLLSEILLRLPPQPSSLPRASLVCKRWRGLASDRGFFRRFRRHHRPNPPLLGFFDVYNDLSFVPALEAPDRVPPGLFSLQRRDGDLFTSLGCRHGLVLVHIHNITPRQVLVWDPFTGDQHRLAIPPVIATHGEKTWINGAVLRVGDVDFQVVLIVADNDDKQHRRALACVYSSETGLWGDVISTPLPSAVPTGVIYMTDDSILVNTGLPAVLVGHSLYWMLAGNFVGILEFDLAKQSLAVIRVPAHMSGERYYQFWITRAEGGGLGLLFHQVDSRFQLWKGNTDSDGVAWRLERTIELDNLLPLNSQSPIILGLAEDNNVVIVSAPGVIFTVHLESLQFKKLIETDNLPTYHPFESVYPTGI